MSLFAATRWTLVVHARGNDTAARSALGELCAAYYQPVVTFLTCQGRSPDQARELAHEFFAAVLAGRSLATADPARGRFRNYLLAAVNHFAADHHDRSAAAKRGGLVIHEELDPQIPGANAPADHERAFDRQWALTILARALATTRNELIAAGKEQHFEILKPAITGDDLPQSEAAAALGMSPGALKVAIHRLRLRFREAVRTEIAHTVPAEADIDEEVHYLLTVLTAGSWEETGAPDLGISQS